MKNIFAFDLTVTQEPSFTESRIENQGPSDNWYQAGRAAAAKPDAVKRGIEDWLKHGGEYLSAIATFHNNPDYVAGYIAHVLGKDLEATGETHLSDGNPAVAIKVYQINGENPFLISYLPYQDQEFEANKQALGNKNSQIEFIRATWISLNLAKEADDIIFYDHNEVNYNAAIGSLDYISGRLVDGSESLFRITQGSLSRSQRPFLGNEHQSPSSNNISMAVLSGFIAVAGIAAVAIAFAVFNAAALNPVGLTLAVVGAVSTVVGLGFFARSMGGSGAEGDDNDDLLTPSTAL